MNLLKAGSGSGVGSKIWVGKNSRLSARYSSLNCCRAILLCSTSESTRTRWAALAVIMVCPNPTIAETIVPVPMANTKFLRPPGLIVLDTAIAMIDVTTKSNSSRVVLVQNSSRKRLLRTSTSADTQSPPSTAPPRVAVRVRVGALSQHTPNSAQYESIGPRLPQTAPCGPPNAPMPVPPGSHRPGRVCCSRPVPASLDPSGTHGAGQVPDDPEERPWRI